MTQEQKVIGLVLLAMLTGWALGFVSGIVWTINV